MVVESVPDWFIVVFVPLVSLWVLYRLWIKPGVERDRNGSDCNENDV